MGVDAEIIGVLLPVLLISDMDVMLVAKAMIRSDGESPTLICTGVLWGAGGGGVVWVLLELLLPHADSARRASIMTLMVTALEPVSGNTW